MLLRAVAPLDDDGLADLGRRIAAGAVAIYPTDTLYALGGSAFSDAVAERVAALKGRPEGKGFPLVAADAAQAFAELEDPTGHGAALAARFWPGPLSIVLRVRPGSRLAGLARQDGSAAIRVPGHPAARALAASAGAPLIATSANPAGEAAPARADEVAPRIVAGADLLLDGGPCAGGPPSTIVDLTGGALRIVREGALHSSQLLAGAGASFGVGSGS